MDACEWVGGKENIVCVCADSVIIVSVVSVVSVGSVVAENMDWGPRNAGGGAL